MRWRHNRQFLNSGFTKMKITCAFPVIYYYIYIRICAQDLRFQVRDIF